jgi:translation initiation factor 2B subunit (eIF-2B alpha/beta/delta family)
VGRALFHQVGHKWKNSQVTGAFYGNSHTALVFQAVACDTTWEQFALFVDELKEEIRIFVINVFDAEFAETAVFFVPEPNFWVAEELYIFS